MNMTVRSEGRQFDRLATMWLGDVEVFRTSTAEPNQHPGIFWNYAKDMTTYSSLWSTNQKIIFDLGNLINEKYTGEFNVSLTAYFFQDDIDNDMKEGGPPADLIIPLSAKKSSFNQPSAFIVPEEKAETEVKLSPNIRRAVLTVAANGQADDEFWWSNVPESMVDYFKPKDEDTLPGMGGSREVQVLIDGHVAGLAWPFPVVFTGGVAPPLHRPLVSPEAFDLREYEIDITPWLGVLSNGAPHCVAIRVVAIDDTGRKPVFSEPPPHWVVSGKIFVWLAPEDFVIRGTIPAVSLSEINYEAKMQNISDKEFAYQQTMSRGLTVKSRLETETGEKEFTWVQNYWMQNDGLMKDSGKHQEVKANYTGGGKAVYGLLPIMQIAFDFVTHTKYWYSAPSEEFSLKLHAELAQKQSLSIIGRTPLYAGLDWFKRFTGRVPLMSSGVRIYSAHTGIADFYQYDGGARSGGSSLVKQIFKLASASFMDPGLTASTTPEARLYERHLEARNDTITRDTEVIADSYGRPVYERGFDPIPFISRGFAPLPAEKFGGTLLFRKPNMTN
jgi:hypothetical protein